MQIQAAFRTDEIRRTPPTPQDEMRAGMSYFHETIWKGVPKFLRRVDTALKNIGINERVPYNAPLIQFSSWMGGDRDGMFISCQYWMSLFCPYTVPFFIYYLFIYIIISVAYLSTLTRKSCLRMILLLLYLNICLIWTAGNPRVTPEVTRDVCLLARMMAANLYFSQIEDLMFEVSKESLLPLRFVI